MSGIGINLRVTGHCSQGGRDHMEDMFSVAYQQTADLKDLEYAFVGIFDGHGGKEAATFAKDNLLDHIVGKQKFWSNNDQDILDAIREGFISTHLEMWDDLVNWPNNCGLPSTAGTTATIAFIIKGKLYYGHVGDSALVLGYQKEDDPKWLAKLLTIDHKPSLRKERIRIESVGGKVVEKGNVARVVWKRPHSIYRSGTPFQSTEVDEVPFLAVARSLGDFWSYNQESGAFSVSPEPDVGVLVIEPEYRCLIFASDGLWNMMDAHDAIKIVNKAERHNEKQVVHDADLTTSYNSDWLNPSKSLIDKALELWEKARQRADNISVVTLMLDPPGPPKAQVLRNNKEVSKSNLTQNGLDIRDGGVAIFTRYPGGETKHHSTTSRKANTESLTPEPKKVTSAAGGSKELLQSKSKRKRIINEKAESKPRSDNNNSDSENQRLRGKKKIKVNTGGKKSKTLENSPTTRTLRSGTLAAIPIKTLRSRNVDLRKSDQNNSFCNTSTLNLNNSLKSEGKKIFK
uniref:PPM-type phosphatase domain-containing protein n=1 Tax=Clastoptera arizonana TaxID=38151 RepID=A0A1B6CBN9_9HEMI